MWALEQASKLGANYCDIRLVSTKEERLAARENILQEAANSTTAGCAVRLQLNGSWGFAAAPLLAGESGNSAAANLVTAAALAAKCYSGRLRQDPSWAPGPIVQASWDTPVKRDPFAVELEEKCSFLLTLNAKALTLGARYCDSFMWSVKESKLFASSEGSLINQELTRFWCEFTPVVIDDTEGRFESRKTLSTPCGCGYEYIDMFDFEKEIETAVANARRKLKSPAATSGNYDLILHPSHLWLTIHETCGHATELDRALGMEANYAGTSFLTPDMLGNFRYGSEYVCIEADRSQPTGLSTCAYDDEGQPTTQFALIENGIFRNYQTNRQNCSLVGKSSSSACAYADGWHNPPLQRMPNISLKPGNASLSLSDLVAATDRGILIMGDGSWSIDHQRRNFQFTGQEFWEIKNGKITGMLRDLAYQGVTPQFWNSCDAICDQSEYALAGSFFCGKGQPPQCAPVSHGSSPARFRSVGVLNTAEKR